MSIVFALFTALVFADQREGCWSEMVWGALQMQPSLNWYFQHGGFTVSQHRRAGREAFGRP